jgi:hypothetical protein
MKAILTFLRKHCPRLSQLDLSEWEDADDRLLRDVFVCSSSVGGEAGEAEEYRNEISQGFAMLQELNLASTWVTDRGMAFLPPSLTRLDLSGLGKAFTDSGLKRLTQRCTRLVALNMCDTSVTNSGLQCLSDDLHHLDVSFTNVCISIGKWKGFGSRDRYTKPVPMPLPRNLRVLNLLNLSVHQAALTMTLLTALCSCQHLRTLHFGSQYRPTLQYTHAWMKMTALRQLTLSNLSVHEEQTLWFLPDGLQELTLNEVYTIRPETFRCLPSSLTSLDFLRAHVNTSGRPWLLKLKRTLPELKRIRVAEGYLVERSKLIDMGVDVGPLNCRSWRPDQLAEEQEDADARPREQNERWRAELEHPRARRLEDKLQGGHPDEGVEEALVPVDEIDVAPDELEEEEEPEEDGQGTLLAVGW